MNTSQRKQHSRNLNLPLLDPDEIVSCLSGFECYLTEEQLFRPTPQLVQTIYAQLASSMLGLDLDHTPDAFEECSVGVENANTQQDAFVLFTLQQPLYNLFEACGVRDFSMDDIIHPTAKRLQLQLSAFINYARFRECREDWHQVMRTELHDEISQRRKEAEARRKKQQRISELKLLISGGSSLEDLRRQNEQKKVQLTKLADLNMVLTEERAEKKSQLRSAIGRLEQKHRLVTALKADVTSLTSHAAKDPEAIKTRLSQLIDQVRQSDQRVHLLRTRSHKLEVSSESLKSFQLDVQACKTSALKLLQAQEINLGTQKQVTRLSHSLELLRVDVDHVESQAQMLRQSNELHEEKIGGIRNKVTEDNMVTQARMDSLRRQIGVEHAERALVVQAIESTHKSISEAEIAIELARGQLDVEVQEAKLESEKLMDKFRSYLSSLKDEVI